MALRMARPWKHPSGVYYIRERIPRDVLNKARGRTLTLPPEAGGSAISIGRTSEHVKASLRAREPAAVKERHATALRYLERYWQALRTGPRSLTHKQIVGLAGLVYRWLAHGGEDDPGPAALWRLMLRLSKGVGSGKHGFADLMISPTPAEARWSSMKLYYGPIADAVLSREGIVTDADSRRRLIEELHRTLAQAASKLYRNAKGDYSLDPMAARFPEWIREDNPQPKSDTGIMALFEGWERESRAAGLTEKTISEYRSVVSRFAKFGGHDDSRRVTPHDVVAWKDARLAQGRSPKTVKDVDLSALKSVFGWAERNHKLPSNPAKGISVRVGKRKRERPSGFTDAEANTLLRAALNYKSVQRENPKTAAAKHWLPWLQAFTGARVGEVGQLRRKDVHHRADHWAITITPEAGSVKNKQARDVPLHPQLVELGFIDYVNSQSGYLFLDAVSSADVSGKLRALKNRVTEFARGIVTDKRVAPNHGWRHRFISESRKHNLSQELRRMITGHAGEGVDEREYGDPVGLYREIVKLPRYLI